MIKRILAICLVLVCCFSLSGCLCSHEWSPADCETPSACTKCGKTEGEALGHDWGEADCLNPAACSRCGAAEGEALGHDWQEADCLNPAACSRCGATEGEALGHDWQDATTEAPKTCSRCALTEGEPIVTDPRFKTANAAELLGRWVFESAIPPDALGLPGFDQPMSIRFTVDFGPDGSFSETAEIVDAEGFIDAVIRYCIELSYLELEAQGISRESADALIMESYGMDMYEFAKSTMGAVNINELLQIITESIEPGGVYYVEDGSLYTGLSWDAPMTPSDYRIDEDGLWVAAFDADLGENTVFRPAEEN